PLHFSCTATPHSETSTLSLHDALPISRGVQGHIRYYADFHRRRVLRNRRVLRDRHRLIPIDAAQASRPPAPPERDNTHHLERQRSEEHTSELQSRENLVCRLLLEKKKK